MKKKKKHFGKGRVSLHVAAVVTILTAFLLKAYYSSADAAGLQWILAPVAGIVSLITGTVFTFDPSLGYVNERFQSVIAPVCAGVNFMIIVFCMTVAGGIRGKKYPVALLIGGALLLAYASTIVVNSFRICAALYMYEHNLHIGWFTVERLHRLTGIGIYLAALFTVHAIVKMLFNGTVKRSFLSGNRLLSKMSPVLWYLGITVGIPVALGKFLLYRENFIEHIAAVIMVCVVILPLVLTAPKGYERLFGCRHGKEGRV